MGSVFFSQGLRKIIEFEEIGQNAVDTYRFI